MLFLLILGIILFWLIGELLGALGVGIALVIGAGTVAWYIIGKTTGHEVSINEIISGVTTITAMVIGGIVWEKVDFIAAFFVVMIILAIGGFVLQAFEK